MKTLKINNELKKEFNQLKREHLVKSDSDMLRILLHPDKSKKINSWGLLQEGIALQSVLHPDSFERIEIDLPNINFLQSIKNRFRVYVRFFGKYLESM